MNINLFHSQLIKQYHERDYASSPEIDFKLLRSISSIFPNDAYYLVDCKAALMHKLSSNIGSFMKDNKDITDDFKPLINHTSDKQFVKFGELTDGLVKLASLKNAWEPFKDEVKICYKTTTDRTYIKSITPMIYDANGTMAFSLGKFTDVSEVIDNTGVRYEFSGPNQKYLYCQLNNLNEFSKVLGSREIEILKYIGEGYSSKSIADILSRSKHTIDTHRRNIIKKLEVTSCIQAYNKAKDLGLFYNQ